MALVPILCAWEASVQGMSDGWFPNGCFQRSQGGPATPRPGTTRTKGKNIFLILSFSVLFCLFAMVTKPKLTSRADDEKKEKLATGREQMEI